MEDEDENGWRMWQEHCGVGSAKAVGEEGHWDCYHYQKFPRAEDEGEGEEIVLTVVV